MSEQPCDLCGQTDGHSWVEGDCVLPHRRHSRRLVDNAQVCEHCVTRWDEQVAEVLNLYSTLETVIPAGSIPEDDGSYEKPRKRPASPAPFALAAWAMMHQATNGRTENRHDDAGTVAYLGSNLPDVPDTLTNWAEAIWGAHSWGNEWPTTAAGAAAAIRADLTTIAQLPDADVFDTELAWMRTHLRQAHGISDPQPLFACMNVECRGNVWRKPHGDPRCDRCGRPYGTLDIVRARGAKLPTRTRLRSDRAGNGHP